MTNRITKLKNALGIGARANRYRIYVTFPTGLDVGSLREDLTLFLNRKRTVESSKQPSITQKTTISKGHLLLGLKQ